MGRRRRLPPEQEVEVEIEAEIEDLERQRTLLADGRFVARAQAIDLIESRILDHLRSLADGGRERQFQDLQRRAEVLRERLLRANDVLWQRLRQRIASGELAAAGLKRELQRQRAAGAGVGEYGEDGGDDAFDLFIDGLLGIGRPTEGTRKREPEMVFYVPTPARVILDMVEAAHIGRDDVFLDLGSGLGRAVLLVNLLTGARARGVEVEPAYCRQAQESASRLNLGGVEFVNADARDADYADGTVFYMYTPFTGKILRSVLERLREIAAKRPIRVCTYGACTLAVSTERWLTRTGRASDWRVSLAVYASQREASPS